jgi:broad specificity phosphatase PhoE
MGKPRVGPLINVVTITGLFLIDDHIDPPCAVRGKQEPRHSPVHTRSQGEADPAWLDSGALIVWSGSEGSMPDSPQAEEAGRQLRSILKPDDTLQFYTSPYRRTRETTEGILRTLTSDDPTPSPFPRNKITVFEEPRIREQDFGNFQPCSAEMERMWQERADYGHFFYRIPDGESAADAYDRVSGFNESLWRSFQDDNFPSVCVLVTHGLMSRVFLMKW